MINAHLSGWKAIADFLGTSVRTAQRWETEFGLPVIRAQGDRKGVVAADPAELEAWFRKSRYLLASSAEAGESEDGGPSRRSVRARAWQRAAVFLVLIALIGAALWAAITTLSRPPGRANAAAVGLALPPGTPALTSKTFSLRRAILSLSSADGWGMTVRVPDGGVATIAVPGSGNFGLSLIFRDDGPSLSLIRLEIIKKSGALSAIVLPGPRKLRKGVIESLASLGCPLGVEWTGEDVASAPGVSSLESEGERCCVTCETRTACSQDVSSSCGNCKVSKPASPR